MNTDRDNLQPGDEFSAAECAELGRLLDARGRAQRSALSNEALERIASMSDLQLPMAASETPVVIARVGHAPSLAVTAPAVNPLRLTGGADECLHQ